MINYIGGHENSARLLKRIRLDKRLSQRELSQLLGHKNQQYVSNIERGKASLPLCSVNKICKISGLPYQIVEHALVEDYKARLRIARNYYDNIEITYELNNGSGNSDNS